MKSLLLGLIAFLGVIAIGELEATKFFPFGVVLAVFSFISIMWGCIQLTAETEGNE